MFHVDNEDSDQTARMRKVCFRVLWLNSWGQTRLLEVNLFVRLFISQILTPVCAWTENTQPLMDDIFIYIYLIVRHAYTLYTRNKVNRKVTR